MNTLECKNAKKAVERLLKKYSTVLGSSYHAKNIVDDVNDYIFNSELKDLGFVFKDSTVIGCRQRYTLNYHCFIDKVLHISWEDEDKKSDGEHMFVISFPSGAYVFGDDYPVDIFMQLFNELKGFNPKYTDSANNILYFELNENSALVCNSFSSIYKKYQDIVQPFRIERRKAELKLELEKLSDGNA